MLFIIPADGTVFLGYLLHYFFRVRLSLQSHGIGVVLDLRSDLFGYLFKEVEHFGIFLLGEEVDLQIQMVSPLGYFGLTILINQDERRKKDRFQRYDEGQKREWEGVEPPAKDRVRQYPKRKPRNVNP